jgi:phosphomethylpyrimidine synthase
MTQLEAARAGRITSEMRFVARREGADPEAVRSLVREGLAVIPANTGRRLKVPCGIGRGLSTKVNANIGNSKDSPGMYAEIAKLRAAIDLGSDTVMDLSTGPGIGAMRRRILKLSAVPVGTVPIYEIAIGAITRYGSLRGAVADEMFAVLEEQAADGVDFFTIHAGVVRAAIDAIRLQPRLMDIVSRGGAFLADWMIANGRENPFYEQFDRVLDIARRHDVTISLGDGMRPGAGSDAGDNAQIRELVVLGELRRRCFDAGVQSMIEGPGHMPLAQIEANVALQKSLCGNAPYYVLGPLVTDIAPGYDHITAAIGGALAAAKGADFLCYVTPAEHLRLPTLDDVREGVIASRIAAHAADVSKGLSAAVARDRMMSVARRDRDWNRQFSLAIEGAKPRRYRRASSPGLRDACTMCGEYCSIKLSEKCFRRAS